VVMVRAVNSVSSESVSMEFTVERPVLGLDVNCSGDMEYVQLGTDIWFQASVHSGTDVRFDWNFGDLESALDAGMESSSLLCHAWRFTW